MSELIGIAGGDDCFPELSVEPLARNRIIADVAEVPRRAPDLILGSWCGKKFQPARVAARPGWSEVPAVRNGNLYEIKSSIILQPGPAALTDGVDEIHRMSRGQRRLVTQQRVDGARPSPSATATSIGVKPNGWESQSSDHSVWSSLVVSARGSRYFSLVLAMISGGRCGPGARLFQSSVSR